MSLKTLRVGAALINLMAAATLLAGSFAAVRFIERGLSIGVFDALRTGPELAVLLLLCLAGLAAAIGTRKARKQTLEAAFFSDGWEKVLMLANQELQAMNDELNKLSLQHREVFESLPDAVVTVDAKGAITSINRTAERLLCLSRADLARQRLTGQAWAAPTLALVRDTLAYDRTVGTAEVELPTPAGPIAVSLTSAPFVTPLGRGAVLVMRDLSLMKQMEHAVLRGERLRSLGELSAGVAHEIRNPLNAIRGFAERLDAKLDPALPYARYPKVILSEVDRLNHLVTDILEFGRERETARTDVDVRDVLDEMLLFVADSAMKRRVRIERAVDDALPVVSGDRNALKQVFLNLALNALDAMPSGGTLTVRAAAAVGPSVLPCRPDGDAAGSALAAVLGARAVEILLIDTGVGMSPEVVSRLFTPFYTTKDHGTGLGLSIAHRIVEQHGGWMDVRSAEGEGTTFAVRLPAAEQAGEITLARAA